MPIHAAPHLAAAPGIPRAPIQAAGALREIAIAPALKVVGIASAPLILRCTACSTNKLPAVFFRRLVEAFP
jgi:hypothetical protein